MSVVAPLRLLIDPALTGPINMARDEALLVEVAAGRSPATIRLYSWNPPTISLGYFQPWREYCELEAPANGLAVVRRTTGGGAILHDRELTYSLALPMNDPWLVRGSLNLYRIMHMAIIAAMGGAARLASDAGTITDASAQRGPFFCFSRRHALDVVLPDATDPAHWSKVAGSAQRHVPAAVLQHGSIMLASRYPQQPCATWQSIRGPRTPEVAAERLIGAIASATQRACEPSTWSAQELSVAAELHPKYSGPDWTEQR